MLSLSDMTLYPLINAFSSSTNTDSHTLKVCQFLLKNKIFDFKRLEDFIRAGHPLVDTPDFRRMLDKAYRSLDKINSGALDASIYKIEEPEANGLVRSFKITDETTKLSDIVFRHPIYKRNSDDYMRWCNIYTAKYLLGKLTANGNNALAAMIPGAGYKKMDFLVGNICAYEDQLARVALNCPYDSEENLFFKDRHEKENFVFKEIDEIANYLIKNGEEFVWGNLTPKAREQLSKAVMCPYWEDSAIRNRLVRLISNYVTLDEAATGLVRNRTLDRFIIK